MPNPPFDNINSRTLREYLSTLPVGGSNEAVSRQLSIIPGLLDIDTLNATVIAAVGAAVPPAIQSSYASQAEAEAGVLNDKGMTPLRTSQYVDTTVALRPEYFLDPAVNPADPTKVAEVTAAVQGALDKVGLAGGGTVDLARRYLVSGVEMRYPNITLQGRQSGRLYDTQAKGELKLAPGSSKSALKVMFAATAGTIRALLVNGDRDNQAIANHGIEMEGTPDGVSYETSFVLEDVRVIRTKGSGIIQQLARRGVRFVRPMVFDIDGDGIFLGGSDNTIEHPIIGMVAKKGIRTFNWNQNIIGGNIFSCENGIFIDEGARHINMTSIQMDQNLRSAIFCNASGAVLPKFINIVACIFHSPSKAELADPTIALGADNSNIIGCGFGTNYGSWTVVPSYSILVPSSTTAGTHNIMGNRREAGADQFGMLSYRGTGTVEQVVSDRTMFTGTRVGFNGAAPQLKSTISGWRKTRDDALLAALNNYGLIADTSVPTDDGFDVLLQEVPGADANGGSAISGRNTRQLTTVTANRNTLATAISAGEFTLPAGTYRITASAQAHRVGGHRVILRNRTTSADMAEGGSEYADASLATMTRATLDRVVTLAAQNTLALEHFCQTARATDGLGLGSTGLTSRFAELRIWRLS